MPVTSMYVKRPVSIPRPRAILPMQTNIPGSQYANVVNLNSSVGQNIDVPDYIGELGKRITSDIAALRANHTTDVTALLNTIKKSQSSWKPNIPNLPPLKVTISNRPGSSGTPVRVSGNVDQWIAAAYRVLGIPLTPSALANERYLIQHESSGNPNAVNNWDSNARAGNPSKGLAQTTGTTFRAYALPGYNRNIFDPVSNLIASLRYRKSRYGKYDIGRYSGGY